MSKANSFFNFIVVAAIIGGAVYLTFGPSEPVKLPSDPQFASRIQGPGPVIVKFGAEWCPPCRQVEKELDQLAKSYAGKISVVKIDVDQQPDLAQHYRVRSIPHLFLFVEGKQVSELKGARSREQLAAWAGVK